MQKFQHLAVKILGLFVQAVTPLGVHQQLCTGNGRCHLPGRFATQSQVLLTADDEGGALDLGKLRRRVVGQAGLRQNQKTVRITLGEETYIVTAITDTGNNLYDKSDGMPIHIVEEGSILKEEQKERLLKEEPERFTFVPYSSLGNSHGLLTVLQVERILILDHGKSIALENQKLGLTNQKLSGNDLFQMLLHPDLEACGHGKGGCI